LQLRLTGQSTPESITPAHADQAARAIGPPFATRAFRGARPLKRWRYVGVFCEQFMAAVASVQVGPARQYFWAVLWRADGRLRERTRMLRARGSVELSPGRLLVRDAGIALALGLREERGVQALCRHGRGEVWTRKQAGVPATGTLALDGGAAVPVQALAVIDDTAGYHARRTEWWWSAGVGSGPDGLALGWNLVRGVNDPPRGSERAVWVAGEPRETPPVLFAEDMSRISCEDGSELRFRAEAERARSENLLLVRSDYRAPFGVFSGELPGRIGLVRGLGVVEHHSARW
jgi:hypothetical protein